MSEDHMRQVEINGVKCEVDTRNARVIESYRVGDRVKLLHKEQYQKEYTVSSGVIVGFEMFEKLPTIVVAYVQKVYSDWKVKFAYLNAQTQNTEITPMTEAETNLLERDEVLQSFDMEILKKRQELDVLERQRAYFLDQFGAMFGEAPKHDHEEAGA